MPISTAHGSPASTSEPIPTPSARSSWIRRRSRRPTTLTVAPAAFDLAIENLSSECAAQPACQARFPDLRAAIQEATEKLDAAPVTIEVDGTVEAARVGHPIKVVVDGAAYLRFVRYTLGSGGGELAAEIVRTTRARAGRHAWSG